MMLKQVLAEKRDFKLVCCHYRARAGSVPKPAGTFTGRIKITTVPCNYPLFRQKPAPPLRPAFILNNPALALHLGLRYFRQGGRRGFVSLVAWISLLGIFLGVLSLIVVMSVMNGFEAELRGRVLALVPHGDLRAKTGVLRDWQSLAESAGRQTGVAGVAPFVGGSAMLVSESVVRGAQLSGIDAQAETTVSSLHSSMIGGSYVSTRAGDYGIVLGELLARQLRVAVGDPVSVILPKVTVTPLGLYPREKVFTVTGLFSTGSQLDGTHAYIQLGDAQRLYQTGSGVNGLRLQFTNIDDAPRLIPEIAAALPGEVVATSWAQSQGSLFRAVKMEKILVKLLLLFIVLIAAFNIISILTMAVSERRGSIAVLRSMGMQPLTVMGIFIVYGMCTGVFGVAFGVLLGAPLAIHIGSVVAGLEQLFGAQVFNPQVYFITAIPSVLNWREVAQVAAVALGLSFLATLYPAWRAAQVMPAEALRYE